MSLIYQSHPKDIRMKAVPVKKIQLVREFSSDHARLEVEYYFGMDLEEE